MIWLINAPFRPTKPKACIEENLAASLPTLHFTQIALLLISRHLERIADRAKNIAEEVVSMIEGEIVRHGRLATEPE